MSTRDIIVGSAGTREGRAALDWALRRAERTTTPVTVVYVADPDSTHGLPGLTAAAESHGELVLERDAFLASTKAPNATVSTVVERGRPTEKLAEHAHEGSLLVLGAHDALSRISPTSPPSSTPSRSPDARSWWCPCEPRSLDPRSLWASGRSGAGERLSRWPPPRPPR
jgi:nucleotide-binding universal stress UspA family protein